jgi:hypothetical protein
LHSRVELLARGDGGAEEHHEHDDEEQGWQRVDEIDKPHHEVVYPASEPAGDGAVYQADGQGRSCAHNADGQGDACAVNEATQHIPAQEVGTQPVLLPWSRVVLEQVPIGVAFGGQQRRKGSHHCQEEDNTQA